MTEKLKLVSVDEDAEEKVEGQKDETSAEALGNDAETLKSDEELARLLLVIFPFYC